MMVFTPCLKKRRERFSPIHLVHRGEGQSGCDAVYLYSLVSGTPSGSSAEFNSFTICSCYQALRLWFNVVHSVLFFREQ